MRVRNVVLLGVAAIAAIALVLTMTRPTAAPAPTATPTATRTTLAPVPPCAPGAHGEVFATGAFEERVARTRAWAGTHPGQRATVIVTDEVFTAAGRAATEGTGTRDVAVRLDEAGALVTAVAPAGPFLLNVRARLVPRIDGGRVVVDVRDVEPGIARAQITEQLREITDPAQWDVRLRVDTLTLRRGCAAVSGIAR